ncbi:PP2C family protein-serine/threonine phosphatase [Modestobacter versicolor]|uniref:Serine phosphatase RsbU (Regulator of sigma subunit) n=1 Tax=Modestobacter versicolor TaxID=429133 RepID=A0A839Y7T1_9ACTN|nr:GAF domain-containing SpoIIE family protein phosphatase [Modestobacter versicolor]MBB3677402.1 serine phosphatase RsbU (regulator of sigma subunit) [Modestobacter versicolor]
MTTDEAGVVPTDTRPLPVITPLPAVPDPAFERFVRLVRRQLGVPVALVSLVDAQEQVFPGAAGLPEPYASSRRTPLTHSFCQHVVTAGEPLVVEDARVHPLVRDNLAIRDLAVVAYAGMPLVDADGVVVGSLCAIHDRPHRWSTDELAVLADLADACSSELQLRTMRDRADQAARRAAEQFRRTQELLEERSGVAEQLQRAMLTRLPQGDGTALAARYVPAHSGDAVGGDWYDAFGTADGALVVAVGDTSGHDITAASDMGQLRTLLRGYAVDRDEPPSETVRRLDRAMATLSVDTLATVVLGRIEHRPAGGHVLRWTNAGHPPPLLLHADGRVDVLGTRPELLVGVLPEAARTDHLAELPAGSTLLFYSDGLIEQRAAGRDIDAGTAQLVEALGGQSQLPLDALLDRVLARVVEPRDDDIVVLAVRTDPLA